MVISLTGGNRPGSAALASYENLVANESAATLDGFGHGTHVASVAAGRGFGFYAAPDHTGVAPGADIYDVKVLGDTGTGTLSDTIEGINWVIYHAREYNIRVMNLSLAAQSTQSWINDPLCIAARSATANWCTSCLRFASTTTRPLDLLRVICVMAVATRVLPPPVGR